MAHFLYDQRSSSNAERSGAQVDISQCPKFMGKVYSYTSATAIFYAPSDLSGAGGMYRQCIHASSSWQNGPKQYDCVIIEKDPSLSGFQNLFVAKVLHFFDFEFRNKYYPCALVHWFDSIGDQPCPNTGMWMVEPECNDEGEPTLSVIHLNCIMQPAHLISIYDTTPIPKDLHYSDSLSAFSAFYINKFSDYHAYGLAFQFNNT